MKKLNFVGIGGATNILLGGNCSYLNEGENLLIIDMCEGATERLEKDGVFQGVKKIYTEVATETFGVHIKYDDIVNLDKEKLVLMHFNIMELYNKAIKDGFEVAKKSK